MIVAEPRQCLLSYGPNRPIVHSPQTPSTARRPYIHRWCISFAFNTTQLQCRLQSNRQRTYHSRRSLGGAYRLTQRVLDERAQTDLPGCSRCRHRLGMPRCILQYLDSTILTLMLNIQSLRNPFPFCLLLFLFFFLSSLYICCRARYRFCSRQYKIARSVRDAAGESSSKYNFFFTIHTWTKIFESWLMMTSHESFFFCNRDPKRDSLKTLCFPSGEDCSRMGLSKRSTHRNHAFRLQVRSIVQHHHLSLQMRRDIFLSHKCKRYFMILKSTTQIIIIIAKQNLGLL
jgi:hypothetical protein